MLRGGGGARLAGPHGDADDAVAVLLDELGGVREDAVLAVEVELYLGDEADVDAARRQARLHVRRGDAGTLCMRAAPAQGLPLPQAQQSHFDSTGRGQLGGPYACTVLSHGLASRPPSLNDQRLARLPDGIAGPARGEVGQRQSARARKRWQDAGREQRVCSCRAWPAVRGVRPAACTVCPAVQVTELLRKEPATASCTCGFRGVGGGHGRGTTGGELTGRCEEGERASVGLRERENMVIAMVQMRELKMRVRCE